jgi:hypothetical protein
LEDYTVLVDEPDFKVKKIVVHPDKRLSYQQHSRRSEHCLVVVVVVVVVVVAGTGQVVIDGRSFPALPGVRSTSTTRSRTGCRTWGQVTSSSSKCSAATASVKTTSSVSTTTSDGSRDNEG